MLRLLDRWRAEPDDRKKDRIMETIWSMREMLDSLNLTVAMKNDKKQRR
jgi:hypothetical protein